MSNPSGKTYEDRFGGLERIFGDGSLEKLRSARVAVIGIGGVGTWVVESLARSGVGHLLLVDLDDICITNTNRQLHAYEGQVGRMKTEAMAERARLINPEISIQTLETFFTPLSAGDILTPDLDLVVDAIDSTADKAFLVKACRDLGLSLVISGGAGGKVDPTKIQAVDLGKVTGDPLIKALRRQLKESHGIVADDQGLYGLDCVFSTEPAVMPWNVCSRVEKPGKEGMRINCASGFGAASFVTGAFGLALASLAVRKILNTAD